MAATKTAQASETGSEGTQQNWDSWFKNQRAFFDQQIKTATEAQNQWSGFFQEWQKSLSPTMPGANQYQQFFTQAGKQFLDMQQQFYQWSGQDKQPADMTGDWLKGLQGFFLSMLQTNTAPYDPAQAWKNMSETFLKGGNALGSMFGGNFTGGQGFGSNPFAGQGFNPAAWTSSQPWNVQGAGSFQNFDPFGFYASLPGIGYTREKQDAWNLLYKLYAEFEQQTRKYNAAMAQVGIEAVQKFQDYVANPPADAAPLTSLKEVYAKWVDVCEDVYARYATSDEYTKLYGEVVNALMAFKGQVNTLVDDMADQFNLPTRSEVDSLHQRLHALRRDNIELRKLVDEIRGVKSPKSKAAGAPSQGKKQTKKGGK
ncbi:MAG TPA: poly(R)-hydroxyalkanoic acid synthase subunit PhaE [Patescibacteria group bacterium]|nr:poly(R)-hydroxyalkanoic acid synthase subunit PhaE [Patescibacteria group bacterium]